MLRVYERRPIGLLRRIAVERAEHWIVRRQEADGSWGGIQPPWVYSLIALHLGGYALEHPVMRRGLEGIERFMVEDRDDSRGIGAPSGESRRLEACQSPVWDTALAIVALSDAGVEGHHPAMLKAAAWLLGEEVSCKGDWSVARPRLAPGGWAFEFENVNYPDVDDTAEVVLALKRVREPPASHDAASNGASRNGAARGRITRGALPQRLDGALERALAWVEGMQSRDGGWGAFDADNTRAARARAALPRLRRGHRPAERRRHRPHRRDARRARSRAHARRQARRALADRQPGALGLVVRPLGHQPRLRDWRRRARADRRRRRALRGVHPPGGALARAPPERGRGVGGGPALLRRPQAGSAAGRAPPPRPPGRCSRCTPPASARAALARGVEWLVATQRPDGSWDEPQYTGTGFPCDYYINYHLYRLTFPLMALGRCLAAGPPGGESAQAGAALES